MGQSIVSKRLERLIRIVEEWHPKQWYPLAAFAEKGKGVMHFRRGVLKWKKDRSGIYFLRCRNLTRFYDATGIRLRRRLFYVGRSGTIASRINGHVNLPSHFSASLVYLITCRSIKKHHNNRNKNMSDDKFFNRFSKIQSFLRYECEMAFVSCPNNQRQALLEIMFSIRFKTQFNEWKTH